MYVKGGDGGDDLHISHQMGSILVLKMVSFHFQSHARDEHINANSKDKKHTLFLHIEM